MLHVFVPTPSPERALTAAQKQALLALRRAGGVDAAVVAERAGLKPNGATLALQALERRGLVARQDGEPRVWSVTFAGHALAERLSD